MKTRKARFLRIGRRIRENYVSQDIRDMWEARKGGPKDKGLEKQLDEIRYAIVGLSTAYFELWDELTTARKYMEGLSEKYGGIRAEANKLREQKKNLKKARRRLLDIAWKNERTRKFYAVAQGFQEEEGD